MQRPLQNEYNPTYQKYFDLVPGGDYLNVLRQNTQNTIGFFGNIPFEKHDYNYAPAKWTVKELLLHIIDTERVFAYRGLIAARGDNNIPIHRMDEELYARNAIVSNRTMKSLLAEFIIVRNATEILFENVTEDQSEQWCNIISHPMTTRAIGYFIIGHTNHHINIIKERYLGVPI